MRRPLDRFASGAAAGWAISAGEIAPADYGLGWVGFFIVLALVLTVLVFLLVQVENSAGRVYKMLACPLKNKVVRVCFAEDLAHPERYSDVCTCTAFVDPRRVTCGKPCLNRRIPLST